MNKVLLYNPKSAIAKHRVPNSLMNIAASVEGIFEWVIVDGNREEDPYGKISEYLSTGQFKYIGFTVMPGPQLANAVMLSVGLSGGVLWPGLIGLIAQPGMPAGIALSLARH